MFFEHVWSSVVWASVRQLCWWSANEAANDKLLQVALNDNHILSSLLPPKSDNRYNLRKQRTITENTHLFNCNFILFGYFSKTVINYFYILTRNSI